MLTEKDQDFVLKNATNWFHLIDCNSTFFGEPFLKDGYIYYFDGRVVTLIPERIGKKTDSKSINDVLASISIEKNPERIIVWGETPTKEIDLLGYKSEKTESPIWKTEMRFHTRDFVPTKSYRYTLNKAKKLGLEIQFVTSRFYKSEYMKLLADTHENLLNLKSLYFYTIYPHIPYVKFAEILKDGEIVSVYILVELLPRYVVIAEVGYNKDIPRISSMGDVLLLEYYRDKSEVISYGGCETKGNFDYKKQYIGEIAYYTYPNLIWYDFYKKSPSLRWLDRMVDKQRPLWR
jgi:hypothetical protein